MYHRVDAISKSCINLLPADTGDSKTDTEEYTFGRPEHYRENCKTPGYFAFTVSFSDLYNTYQSYLFCYSAANFSGEK